LASGKKNGHFEPSVKNAAFTSQRSIKKNEIRPKSTSTLNARNLYAAERLVMKRVFRIIDAPFIGFQAVNELEGFIFPGE